MDGESLKLLLAQGVSVEEIARRFGKNPATVSYWMKKHGLVAPNREKYASKGGIDQETLEELVERGMTIAEIATEVGLSKTAVRHWLRKHGLKTKNGIGPRLGGRAREAKDAGKLSIVLACVHHGETEFVIEGRGYYRCKRCRSDGVAKRRRRLKQILVEEAGGSCRICGYDRHLGALEFHHVNPAEKRLQISWNGVTQSIATLREEARKCVLLCSNCHAEVEAGIVALPATVSSPDSRLDSPA
jgi:transposase-like protein